MDATVDEIANVEAWSGKDRGDENFPVGSWLIRADLRTHVHAFYAFARNADDIADSPTLTPEDKIARLDIMEEVLLGRRDTGSPSALRLRESLAQTGVTPKHAAELLIAFRQDAVKRRYATLTELYDYCRYSAVPVGRHVLDLHGEPHKTHAPSDALCTSLQVLNHIQDCVQDYKRLDRCYLPQRMLEDANASPEHLLRPAASPGVRRVFDSLLHRVDRMNHFALDLPKRARDRRLRVETAAILSLSKRLAARLQREDPVRGRVALSKADKVGSLLVALRFLL
ncbi:MAG TPA: squalene synthase HpnC [Acetobacteraceae bacterium]|nr:squalene synthase HpnC [Acetobacteraceae bacterium]